MRLRGIPRAWLAVLPLAAFACATAPDFTYSSDIDGGDASVRAPEGGAAVEASATDSTVGDDGFVPGDDGFVPGDDATDDGGIASDAESLADARDGAVGDGPALDGTPDAAEAGCGPVDNASNCGACGVACDLEHSDGAACSLLDAGAGVCTYTSCSTGYADCDATPPNVNGCETPITTVSNCGACGLSCNTANSVDASCGATGCTYACAPGFSACDAAPPNANGCSTSLTTVANCGTCGLSCNTANSVDAGCGASGCTYACAPNFANCNTTSAAGNAGGCACNTPACCATSGATPGAGGPGYGCETAHSNGVAQTFYDCEPAGTYTEAQALEACVAYVTTLGLTASACEYPAGCTYVIEGEHETITYDAVLYLSASDTGYVWVFDGTLGTTTGTVYAAGTFCSITRPAGATWN
jgi:hypothetical protein